MRWSALTAELSAVRLATFVQLSFRRRSVARLNGEGRRRTVADAAHSGVGVDGVLAEVREAAGLLDEGGRETVRVRLVVDELRVDEVPDLQSSRRGLSTASAGEYSRIAYVVSILERELRAESKVLECVEERLRLLRDLLEL